MISQVIKEGIKGGLCQLTKNQLNSVVNHTGPMKLDGVVYQDEVG